MSAFETASQQHVGLVVVLNEVQSHGRSLRFLGEGRDRHAIAYIGVTQCAVCLLYTSVRPPRLGGNTRMGVFATRSPFRPNHIGLSCVQLEKVDLHNAQGPVLHVAGADLMDGTPIYDRCV